MYYMLEGGGVVTYQPLLLLIYLMSDDENNNKYKYDDDDDRLIKLKVNMIGSIITLCILQNMTHNIFTNSNFFKTIILILAFFYD